MINEKQALKYCKNFQLIENYKLAIEDETQVWDCHHRREIDEMKSRMQLIGEGRYYDVDASELVFLTKSAHMILHNKDKNLSEEHRRKISESSKGKKNGMCGKQHSEEARKKMSKSSAWKGKQLIEEHKKKISESCKGKHWYNNGNEEVRAFTCPDDFIPGRLKKVD